MIVSIQNRVTFWAGLSLIGVVAALSVIGYIRFESASQAISEQSRKSIEQQVESYLEVLAGDISSQVAQELLITLKVAETTASTLESQLSNSQSDLSREQVIELLSQNLSANPEYLGTFVAFEPNQFDGPDTSSRNAVGSDANGRFLPYVVKGQTGETIVDLLLGYEDATRDSNGVRAGEYYLCSKDSNESCIIDPYLYPIDGVDVLLTSLVSPVTRQGRFVGVSGVDIRVDFLQQLATEATQKLYEGQGSVKLISPNGIIAADTLNPDYVGSGLSVLDDAESQILRRATANRGIELSRINNELVLLAPFLLPGNDKTWLIQLKIREDIAFADIAMQEAALHSAQRSVLTSTIVAGLVVGLIGVLVIFLVIRNAMKPIQQMKTLVASIAEGEGDLTHQLKVTRNDETGELSISINTFIDKLASLIRELIPLGNTVGDLAKKGTDISSKTTKQVDQQKEFIDQVVTAVTQMASSAQEIAESAGRTSEFANKADLSAKSGASIVNQTSDAVAQVHERATEAVMSMESLARLATDITGILKTIQSIAEQTNLLALNAAIEAARAGEQGRGFAVVADEVRALAARTQSATVDIGEKLKALQDGSDNANNSMTKISDLISNAVELASSAEKALTDIAVSVNEISAMTYQIATATEEQSSVCEEVSRNMTAISQSVDHTHTGAIELKDIGQSLDQAASGLAGQLTRFKV